MIWIFDYLYRAATDGRQGSHFANTEHYWGTRTKKRLENSLAISVILPFCALLFLAISWTPVYAKTDDKLG
jgi:hypothetical protein